MSAVLFACAAVIALNVYAAVLVLLRSAVYRVPLYRPMLLNIALSFLPVLLALVFGVGLVLLTPALALATELHAAGGTAGVWIYLVIATAVWLLMFPNSVYLITELNFSHRVAGTPVPLWFDIVQTLALTLSGIANAVLSLAVVQTMFILVVDPPGPGAPTSSWVFAGAVIVLGAVGVYLGRYLRFNSWDVRHPGGMLRKLVAHLRLRGKALEAAGFVLTHAVLVALLYAPLFALGWTAVTARAV